MSISNVTSIVQQKTTLSTSALPGSVYVGDFDDGSGNYVPEFVALNEPFTLYDMLVFLDEVQASRLQTDEQIFDKNKQFKVADFTSYFSGSSDLSKRFCGLLLLVMDATFDPEFNSWFYPGSSDEQVLMLQYKNETKLPPRPRRRGMR